MDILSSTETLHFLIEWTDLISLIILADNYNFLIIYITGQGAMLHQRHTGMSEYRSHSHIVEI
jgi:hypothetical protein